MSKKREVAGWVVMLAEKGEPDFMAPMAYGDPDRHPYSDELLRDRGLTLFPTKESAREALEDTLRRAEEKGAEWPSRYAYSFVEVSVAPGHEVRWEREIDTNAKTAGPTPEPEPPGATAFDDLDLTI